jgi:hypothetical protein
MNRRPQSTTVDVVQCDMYTEIYYWFPSRAVREGLGLGGNIRLITSVLLAVEDECQTGL